MAPLARAVAELLVRGGWLVGLVVLETLLLAGFWWAGPTPFGDAFDRRAAEADLLLLTLASLPPLVAGALLSSGDREDGLAEFYRSCRVTPQRQVLETAAGLFAVVGGALLVSLPFSLALAAPASLVTASPWISLVLALFSTLVHGAWGLALGAWVRSRWAAVALAMAFWLVTAFALEALVSAAAAAVPVRWSLPLVFGLTALDPSELTRVASVLARGQSWAFGPSFAAVRDWAVTVPGVIFLTALVTLHLVLPGTVAVQAWKRGAR